MLIPYSKLLGIDLLKKDLKEEKQVNKPETKKNID
jgi:hypothetical protein